MLQRFAAGSAVAAALLGIASAVALLVVPAPQARFFPILRVWCFVPALWGLWAMIAPRAWTPKRLPWWGAILGLLLGSLIMFVLNLPEQVLGQTVPVGLRAAAVGMLTAFYYLLWMIVRVAWRKLCAQ